MLRTVLESLDCNPALMPLTVHRLGRSLGLCLTADLRTIIADPALCRTPMAWRGAPPDRIATVVAAGGRHLALTAAVGLQDRDGGRENVCSHAA